MLPGANINITYEENELISVDQKLLFGTHLKYGFDSQNFISGGLFYYDQSIMDEHVDIGFTDAQKYFNVYTVDQPLFFQTSSNGTNQKLTSYPTHECFTHMKSYWLPTQIY